ncbi:MAG TPA: extracellular solute-binding protein [Clostridia bacterium]|nr:extracellular solute-binding protein [Clostridia bacterium]
MLRMKKVSLIIVVVLCFALVMTACNSTSGTTATATAPATAATATVPAEKIKLKFYGKIVEYTSGEAMCKALQDKFKDKYEIEMIQVDWGNLEKVVRTGIASGDPADVYQWWPTQLKKFIDSQMCLDLTPYLEADSGAWKNTFVPSALDSGKYDGKYYGLPEDSNFAIMYANADLFEKAGVAIPSVWTWDEFVQASKAIKEKAEVFPFVVSSESNLIAWLPRFGMASTSMKAGIKSEDLSTGKVDFTAAYFTDVLKNLKDYNAAQYLYPGKGSITQKRDEAKAAFIQGKVAILAEVSSFAAVIAKDATFKLTAIPWPSMGNKSNAENGDKADFDGLFVPANAAHPDASVELLKAFYSPEIMKIHADNGYAPCVKGVEISNPVIKALVDISGGMSSTTGDPININAKMNDYFSKMLMADLCLANISEADIMKKIAELAK